MREYAITLFENRIYFLRGSCLRECLKFQVRFAGWRDRASSHRPTEEVGDLLLERGFEIQALAVYDEGNHFQKVDGFSSSQIMR